MPYLWLFLQGAVIVAGVSWQTTNLIRGEPIRIWVGACLVGAIWILNAGGAADAPAWGWLAYGCGSGCGAVAGWRVGRSVPVP